MKRKRKGDKWPFIRWAEKEQAWRVDARTKDGGQRRFFETQDLAEAWAEQQRIKRKNEGSSAFEFSAADRIDAVAALAILAPFKVSLQQAARFYEKHAAIIREKRTIKEIIDELLAAKKTAGLSPRYLKDLRIRLNSFASAFGSETAINVSLKAVDDWLLGLQGSAITRNNYRRILRVFFGFALERKYLLEIPISTTSKSKEVKGKPGILSVAQCVSLLEAADAEILPAIALGMFAGLRPEAEIWRLDWSKIDFASKEIDIEPEATKNSGDDASVRYVDMSDNLIAWLTPHRKKSGPVSPTDDSYFKLMRKARKAANITAWPHDALRHSFCSYHYAAHHDAGKTMSQSGHTKPRTFFKHYRKRVKPAEANRYWQIMPDRDAGKIVAIA